MYQKAQLIVKTEHKKASDVYMLDILCAIEETATANLPLSSIVNEKDDTTRMAMETEY